jgi:hypothetical protein
MLPARERSALLDAYERALREEASVAGPARAAAVARWRALLGERAASGNAVDARRADLFGRLVAVAHEDLGPEIGARILATIRRALVGAFSFAVPTAEALGRVAALGPVVEVGCGGGYWARCLTELGAEVRAYDRTFPENPGRKHLRRLVRHHAVRIAEAGQALAHEADAKTLLLCWPPGVLDGGEAPAPVFSTMGEEALARFRGEHLVLVGELSASFGSPAFFARLYTEFRREETIALPNLGAWRDALHVFRRG